MGPRRRKRWAAVWLAAGLALLSSCGGDPLAPQLVGSITLSPASISVAVGATVQLTATVRDAAGNPLVGHAVTWSTSDAGKATVSPTGLVTAIATGSVSIAAASEGKSATAQVSVAGGGGNRGPVAIVILDPSPSSVILGGSFKYNAVVKSTAGDTLTDRTLTWTTTNPAVATVATDGTVRGMAPGTTTISAATDGKTGVSQLTVSTVAVASVTVTPATATGVVGDTVRFTAVTKDASGNVLIGRLITWRSSSPSIAVTCMDGLVTGSGAGVATITATAEGQSGTARLTVGQAPVATVAVTPNPATVVQGATLQLTATLTDANGYQLSGRTTTWSTSAAGIATVSTSGVVTGVAPGTATITATSEGKSGTTQVTVTPIPVATVTVTPNPASVSVGGTVQLTATLKAANGTVLTGRVVTWASSNTSLATVSTSGLVRGVAPGGPVTITATSEGKSGTSQATVTSGGSPGPVATVAVSPSFAMVAARTSTAAGGTVQLVATLRDAQGNVLTGQPVTWTSNSANATVSSTGLVTAAVTTSGPASATITATSSSISGTGTVNVTYAGLHTDGYCAANSARLMDVYEPAASFPRPLPAAIFIHGGSWQSGDKSAIQNDWRFNSIRTELMNRGYVVVSLNYRLATATSNKWPAQINDVKCAVRHLRGYSTTRFGIDVNRMGVWGTSAGAHLASLLGTTTPADGFEAPELSWGSQSSAVSAVVDFSGPADLTRPSELNFDYSNVFTTWPDSLSTEMVNASPVSHVGETPAAFLIFHGDSDPVVALAQSNRFYNALLPHVPALFQLVTNADHQLSPVNGGSISPSQTQIVQQAANFFDQYIKNAASPSFAAAAFPGSP